MANRGEKYIFVFTGPDGSGRKTVADAVGITLELNKVVSYTTRGRRPIEEEGQDYHFVSEAIFREAVSNGEFIEHVTIDGFRYGIKGLDIERLFENGSVYVVLNRNGADLLKRAFGERVVRIFIYADLSTVIERQRSNGLAEEEIARHVRHYEEDMAYGPECEHSVENINDLGHTVYHVANMLEAYLQRDLIDCD